MRPTNSYSHERELSSDQRAVLERQRTVDQAAPHLNAIALHNDAGLWAVEAPVQTATRVPAAAIAPVSPVSYEVAPRSQTLTAGNLIDHASSEAQMLEARQIIDEETL